MKLVCKNCNVEITKSLQELQDRNLLNKKDGEDYIPVGFYIIGDGSYDDNSLGNIIVNLKDLINSKHHMDSKRLNGCCGLDGLDGINTVCVNNHDIGTESSDCWMAHYILFEHDTVNWIAD